MNNIASKSLEKQKSTEKTNVDLQQKEEELLISLIYKDKKIENQRDKGISIKNQKKLPVMSLSELAAKTSKL